MDVVTELPTNKWDTEQRWKKTPENKDFFIALKDFLGCESINRVCDETCQGFHYRFHYGIGFHVIIYCPYPLDKFTIEEAKLYLINELRNNDNDRWHEQRGNIG